MFHRRRCNGTAIFVDNVSFAAMRVPDTALGVVADFARVYSSPISGRIMMARCLSFDLSTLAVAISGVEESGSAPDAEV